MSDAAGWRVPERATTNAGRSIVVTGAGSGIGRATVQVLAGQGAKVVAVDLTPESLAWLDEEPELSGVVRVSGSVTDTSTNAEMVAALIPLTSRSPEIACL
ncbi:MAG: SDR family NAD(P)-dependent oxidoreductase [Acidimicrobiia bacterium]|nr:SDR family NAD(P)-dependent oxidoreductase [Acidimicrobiia bacterium]MDH4362907.1 SDR family NAD(P)-dependent oxidoreductase [Acidimicrobiia bacterium]MDH5289231.1 SDR family NAD(P)-dependent oxidoreductase [Acidimicrobiia bacterium]